MATYLSIRTGEDKGKQFLLDPDRPTHIGRGSGCEIVLSDPVSSRFHAVVFYEDGWHLRDTDSSNGTLVNGQKTDSALLMNETRITVGHTELELIDPECESHDDTQQTMVKSSTTVRQPDSGVGLEHPSALVASSGLLLDLYQLSLGMMHGNNADDVTDSVIRLLRERTDADLVGLSVDSGNGRLKPQRVVPTTSAKPTALGRKLSRRVVTDGEAIWLKRADDSLVDDYDASPWTDAIYVPLSHGSHNLGVLHAHRSRATFDDVDFELVVAASRLLAICLTRMIERDTLRADHRRIADQNAGNDELIGSSPTMIKLKERIGRIGRANGSVLIRGESGVGKELVARGVHRASQRSQRPMLTVNCAAIPQDLIESQLFGHRKGSFTGADADHIGWFQQAHTGTLFLDEIGELTLDGQAKLLRILEGHPFLPVGATEEVLVDVRVIAATNRDLAEFVREKRFREDLFYRLSVFELVVPPLRDRHGDIEILIDHFLEHFCVQHARTSLKLSDSARERLLGYAWPGNVRQLRNVIDSAVVMADDPLIEEDDIGLHDAGLSRIDTLRLDEWERRLIGKALKRTGGSVPEAAKLLGVSRATAYRKITEYEIDR